MINIQNLFFNLDQESSPKRIKSDFEIAEGASEDSDTSALDNEDLSFHLATFEKSGKLGPLLKALKNSLMAVQGTSTECERSFSTSGLIVTPMRTRIKFDLFNAVLF